MAETDTAVSAAQGNQTLVLRNALLLVVAQAASMPISILVNAVMARYLGAEEFGYFYLASTLTAFGFLLVDWGQSGTLPAMVARDRARAGEFLGSGLVWRALSAPVVYGLLALAAHLLGYPRPVQVAIALLALHGAIGSALAGCQDTVRGFERTDIAAYSMVAQPLLAATLVLPVLALGGRLNAVLVAYGAVAALVLLFVSRALRPVGVGRIQVRPQTTRDLIVAGWPFLFFGVTMALQPNIDAIFLSKLAPAAVVGWHAAARRLLGAIVFPASALVGALYPTLCRLYGEDEEGFRSTCREALRTSLLVVAPLALGTFLYADAAISIFSKEAFGPAADNLRLLAPFVLLVYVSMPLGSSLMAAGRQRTWAGVQMLCVLVSLVLNPLLVPWFQQRTGNGGLGICVATVASEALMVGSGVWLMPRGVLHRAFVKSLLPTLAAGGAMVLLSLALRSWTPWVAGPVSALGYFAAVWVLGGLGEQQIATLKAAIARKTRRA